MRTMLREGRKPLSRELSKRAAAVLGVGALLVVIGIVLGLAGTQVAADISSTRFRAPPRPHQVLQKQDIVVALSGLGNALFAFGSVLLGAVIGLQVTDLARNSGARGKAHHHYSL